MHLADVVKQCRGKNLFLSTDVQAAIKEAGFIVLPLLHRGSSDPLVHGQPKADLQGSFDRSLASVLHRLVHGCYEDGGRRLNQPRQEQSSNKLIPP